ncbi:MAG: leucine-rich repeat domain-containing protein [Kiritimatiellae bacterium]|nr:leucine-rich repeat domain-containing protein [Kiritimatiellia bacterium]
MNKLTLLGVAAFCASVELAAMPTEKELNRATTAVKKLMSAEESARKSNKKTWGDVAAEAMRLADTPRTEAEKFLLMKGAVSYYAKGGDLKKAAEAMAALEAAFSDMSQKYADNIIAKALSGKPKLDVARFRQLKDEAKQSVGASATSVKAKDQLAAKYPNLQKKVVNGINWLYVDAGRSVNLVGADSPLPRDLVIPEEIDGKKILMIEERAFEGCAEIVSLKTSDRLISIGESAFAGCPNLESVRLLSGSVRWSVFRGCPKLKSVFVGKKVRSLEYGSLAACEKLETVEFEEGELGLKLQDPFKGDVGLKALHLPARYDGTESWCHGAFGGCRNLTTLTIEKGNRKCRAENGVVLSADGKTLLAVASGLTEINIPASVETIPYRAIKGCDQIRELVIPDTVKTIDAQSIGECALLETITIGAGVENVLAPKIGHSLFYRCPRLTAIRFLGNAPAHVDDLIYQAVSPALITYVSQGTTGWNRAGGEKLPALWPVDGIHGRKIAYWGDKSVKSFEPEGPYGIHMVADPGCEDGADYVLGKLKVVYLPRAVRYYGDPFMGKKPSRVYPIRVKRSERGMSFYPETDQWSLSLAKDRDTYEFSLDYLASSVLTVCEEPNWASFVFYVNKFVEADAKGRNPTAELKQDIAKGLSSKGGDDNQWQRAHAPLWAALEELRAKRPSLIKDYCNLKNKRFAEGKLPKKLSLDEMAALLREVTGMDAAKLFEKYGVKAR